MDSPSKSPVNPDPKFLDRDYAQSTPDLNGNTKDLMSKCEDKEWDAGFFSHSTSADPMSVDESDDPNSLEEELNSSTYHTDLNGEMVPLNKDELLDTSSHFHPCEANLTYTVPTPVNANLNELVDPLQELTQIHIKEKKYPVLPSITKSSCSPRSNTSKNSLNNELTDEFTLVRETTKNQMDFSRERMEKEADFFADHRVQSKKVKITPRIHPLPPIQPTSDPSPDKT